MQTCRNVRIYILWRINITFYILQTLCILLVRTEGTSEWTVPYVGWCEMSGSTPIPIQLTAILAGNWPVRASTSAYFLGEKTIVVCFYTAFIVSCFMPAYKMNVMGIRHSYRHCGNDQFYSGHYVHNCMGFSLRLLISCWQKGLWTLYTNCATSDYSL